MNALAERVLKYLREHDLVRNVRVVNYDETPWGKVEVKIRCRLPAGHQLQVWMHIEPASLDYAYQLYAERPLLRWDNAPHYPRLSTAPHHHHDDAERVMTSPLCGKPLTDLPIVMSQIEAWLDTRRTTRD
jgi:hypothetical protein